MEKIWENPRKCSKSQEEACEERLLPPSQCALALLPRALAGVLYLLFLPPGSSSGLPTEPPRELQQRSKSLLPGCFLFTQQKQRSREGHLETRIKSRALALQASYLHSPAQKKLVGPDSDVNGMTKRGHCLPIQAKEGAPRPGPPQCMRPQGADCGHGPEPEPWRTSPLLAV